MKRKNEKRTLSFDILVRTLFLFYHYLETEVNVMKILKFFLMILVAPIWLLLTVFIGIFSLIISIASWVFCIIAFILLIVAIFFLITETSKDGLLVLLVAYLLSPWGIPMFATWILSKFIILKEWLTERIY